MEDSTRTFWSTLGGRLPPHLAHRGEEIARVVAHALERRVPPAEVEHIARELPEDLRYLVPRARTAAEEKRKGRGAEHWNDDQFLERVRSEAGLDDRREAERATVSVFAAFRQILSDEESVHVMNQLPRGIRALWGATAQFPTREALPPAAAP